VRDGVEGFHVPPGDSEAIAERIEELAANRELRREMGSAARMRAEEFTWEKYQQRLLAALRPTNEAPLELASY
jgi:glycosyltransferase involved in cell wall biosynthesis